ncbi:hypothetical protein V500_02757 [Pseudogymnoascus sp. VKM F-4518 (FW-2643)]|nr:hypothetical protein V500_02757 [Pseudogymnoascus sp. VKM F-4518 (FW-2643)]
MTPPPTNDPAVPATQVKSLSDAIAQVLAAAQTYLKLDSSQDDDKVKKNAASTLTYDYQASIAVRLDADWTILDSFILNNVYLELALDGYSSTTSEMNLAARVEATWTIADTLFNVSGTLPDLQSDRETDFTFSLRVSNLLQGISAEDFLAAFSVGPSYAALTASLDEDVTAELLKGDANCISEMTLVLHRNQDKSFYLKQISFNLRAGFDWKLNADITVKRVSFSANAIRLTSTADWQYEMGIQGAVRVGDDTVTATALVSLKDTSLLTLQLSVSATQTVTGPQLIDFFVPGASARTSKLVVDTLPPRMTPYQNVLDSVDNPLNAKVVFKKDSQPKAYWTLSSVDVKIFLSGVLWQSIGKDDNDMLKLTLGDLFFSLQVQLATTETFVLPPIHDMKAMDTERGTLITTRVSQITTTYDYKGEIGGVLILFEGQFRLDVKVAYNSTKKLTAFTATLPDGVYGPLNIMAADKAFNPALTAPADLVDTAKDAPAPADSPLSLETVEAPLIATERGLWITFSETELSRAVFKAHFQDNWALTTNIKLTNLGILFDIKTPQDKTARSTSGYVYGIFQIGTGLQLLAFVAGTKTLKSTRFLAGISANLVNPLPDSPLQIAPDGVLSDPAFVGQTVPTDNWGLPPFPMDVATDVLSSVNAYLIVELVQVGESASTQLSSVRARASGEGTWDVYTGVQVKGALTLDVVIRTDKTTSDFVGHVELGGTCTIGLDVSQYIISFIGHVERSAGAPLSYSLIFSIVSAASGSFPTPTTIAALTAFGGTTVDENKLAGKIPDGYPITPKTLVETTSDNITCIIQVQQAAAPATGYTLKRLTFKLEHQSLPWNIITDSSLVVLKYASLDLNIDSLGSNPTYGLVAYGLVSINNSVDLEAGIQLLTALDDPNKAGWFKVALRVSAGVPGQGKTLLGALVGGASDFTVPQLWPFDPAKANATFNLNIYFRKDPAGNWRLSQVDFTLYAETTSQEWKVGPTNHLLPIASLWIFASFTNIDGSGKTVSSISFNGTANLSRASFLISAQLSNSALEITFSAAKDLQSLVGVFIDNGLDNSSLAAPIFESETTLDTYKSGTFADATLSFHEQSGVYSLDTITAKVNAVGDWTIVQHILSLTRLKLTLNFRSIGLNNWDFNATLHTDIRYKKQDGQYSINPVDLKATLDDLTMNVKLDKCSIFDIFYIATAGVWTLESNFFPEIKSLYFYMNWKTGRANFQGQTKNWDLSKDYKNLLGIQSPTLAVDISRSSLRLDASGVISGEAVVAEVFRIPISYDLSDGPLKIFGYDIDEIYKMCKKLYNLIKDLVQICKIMFDIVGVGEAFAVGTALVVITKSVSAVWKAIKEVFGYGDDDDDSDKDDSSDKDKDKTDSNSSGSSPPGTYSWVIGGPGLSNGIASEATNFTLFPKDRLGRPLPITSTKLTVTIIQNNVVQSTISTFTGVSRGGYIVSYVRPPTLGDYTVHISYPVALPGAKDGYSANTTVSVTDKAAVLSAENSILDVSQNLLAGVTNYATIWPRDSFNKPRLGYDESESFKVEFVPPLDTPERYIFYNDSVKVAFVLPTQVGATYTMKATLENGDTPLYGSPATFTSILVVGLDKCIAGGLGLCSGLAGEDTYFSVSVNDQMGNAWVGDMTCTASYTVNGQTTVTPLTPPSQDKNVFHFTYTRPAATGKYYLKIFVGDKLMPDYPIKLVTAVKAVNLSVANSFLSLSAGPYYQSLNIVATITAFDDMDDPGLWRDYSTAGNFILTTKNVVSGLVATWPLLDRGDGTSLAALLLPDLGKYEIFATSQDGKIIVDPSESPLTIEVTVPPFVADARCFGPGLSLPASSLAAGTSTYFDIMPLDQYGRVITLSPIDTTSFLVFMKEEAEVVITPHGRGRRVTYSIPTASPLVPGDIIRVILNGGDVSRSPYVLTSTSATVSANCRVSEWISHQVEEISSFVITAADADGNARLVGGDQVKVTSADADPKWPFVVLNIRDRRDGTYLVRYIPTAIPAPSVMSINVLVNNVAIMASPFSLPVSPITFTAAGTGLEISSLGIKSEFQLLAKDAQGAVNDSAFLHTAVIYPTSTSVLTAVPLTITPMAAPPPGVSICNYTLSSTMPTGDYIIRLLINYRDIVTGSPFKVNVDDPPPLPPAPPLVTTTVVGVDDVYFTTSNAGNFAGSFSVLTTPATIITASDLVVQNSATAPDNLLPVFLVSLDSTQLGVFTVQTGFRIEGSWPVSILFRGVPVLPPSDVGTQWVFNSCDAGKALAIYVPNSPTPSFSIQQQAGIQVQVVAANQSLKFVKDPNDLVNDQYASAGWSFPALDMGPEIIYHFRTRWNALSQASEVKMVLPTITQFSRHEMVVLRYSGGAAWWTVMDYLQDSYKNVTQSAIAPDKAWHFLCFHLSPTLLRIYEDGHLVVATDRRPLTNIPAFIVGFQVFDDAAAFDADVAECVTSPAAFHADFSALSRPLEVLFNKDSGQINQSLYTIQQNPPIPVGYSDNSSLQFATTSAAIENGTTTSGLNASLGPYCALQYRFRINRSDGYESKISIVANLTMRVVSGNPQWQLPTPWDWITLSGTTAFRVGGDYVTVSVIVAPDRLILFENGQMSFEYSGGGGGATNGAAFFVQHYDQGTGVDVELSHLRVLSGEAWG